MPDDQVTDVEFTVVRGRGRVRWGSVVFYVLYIGGFIWAAYMAAKQGDALMAAGMVGAAALIYPAWRFFSLISAPEIPAEEAEWLRQRLQGGAPEQSSRKGRRLEGP